MSKYEPESLPEPTDQEIAGREIARLARDNGASRNENSMHREIACAKRLESGGWCLKRTNHPGACDGVAAQYHPLPPSPDRKLMASFRAELAQKYDTKKRKNGVSPAEEWVARAEGRA